MTAFNLSSTALYIDIVAIFVCGLTYMEYFAQCRYVSCSDSVWNVTYVSPMFKITAIQMKPKENIRILQSTKILPPKSCIFSQHPFTEPYEKWRLGLSGLENFRIRHVVISCPPYFCALSTMLLYRLRHAAFTVRIKWEGNSFWEDLHFNNIHFIYTGN
jgi:hypothetical protein